MIKVVLRKNHSLKEIDKTEIIDTNKIDAVDNIKVNFFGPMITLGELTKDISDNYKSFM